MLNNTALIEHLVDSGVLRNKALIEAFSLVDRKDFVPDNLRDLAYADHPLPIGNEATISQPTTVAFMLELLELRKGEKVLDIGSGSGWTTALMASVVGKEGQVTGLEIVPQLVQQGSENLNRYGFSHAKIQQAGKQIGLPEQAPFDRILVSAAAKELPPQLVEQLADDGILLVPVRESIVRVRRTGDDWETEEYPGFAFVPLQ